MIIEIRNSGSLVYDIIINNDIIIDTLFEFEAKRLKQLLEQVYEAGKIQDGLIIKEEI